MDRNNKIIMQKWNRHKKELKSMLENLKIV